MQQLNVTCVVFLFLFFALHFCSFTCAGNEVYLVCVGVPVRACDLFL